MKNLFKAKELCSMLSISKSTLYRWSQHIDFPQPIRLNRTVLYDFEQVKNWLKTQNTTNS